MSIKFIKICLACWLSCVILIQSVVIAYVAGYIDLNPAEKFLNNCKKNYFYSVITTANNQYSFDEVLDCKGDDFDCSRSIKRNLQAPLYNTPHELDEKTLAFLDKIPDGLVNHVKDLDTLRSFPAINKLINGVTSELKMVWFKKNQNKIYIITTSKPKKFCNKLAESTLRGI